MRGQTSGVGGGRGRGPPSRHTGALVAPTTRACMALRPREGALRYCSLRQYLFGTQRARHRPARSPRSHRHRPARRGRGGDGPRSDRGCRPRATPSGCCGRQRALRGGKSASHKCCPHRTGGIRRLGALRSVSLLTASVCTGSPAPRIEPAWVSWRRRGVWCIRLSVSIAKFLTWLPSNCEGAGAARSSCVDGGTCVGEYCRAQRWHHRRGVLC